MLDYWQKNVPIHQSATPEVADKKGIRACPLDEPNAT